MRELLRLLRLLSPLRWKLLSSVVLGTATIAASIGLLGSAAFLIAAAALHPSISELQVAIVGVRFFGISRGVFRYFERLFSHDLSFRILARIRVHFMDRLEKLAPAVLTRRSGGELLDGALSSIENLQHFYVRCVGPPLVALLIGIGSTAFLACFSFRPALVFAVFYGFSLFVMPLLSWHTAGLEGKKSGALKEKLSRELIELIQGAAEFQVSGSMDIRNREWLQNSRMLLNEEKSAAFRDGIAAALHPILQHGAVWAMLIVGIPLLRQGVLSGPVLSSLVLVGMAAFEAGAALPQAARGLRHQLESARKVFDLLDRKAEVEQPVKAQSPPRTRSVSPLLECRGISLIYPGMETPALEEINLSIEPGMQIAVTGPSGSGKSTLLHLLLRFYDPNAGEILYEGVDIRRMDLDGLRRQLGLLSQRTQLFTGSIAENLRMARPSASLREMEDACRAARLLDEIQALPQAWETWIGSGGRRLSGGQRRRLALARTLLQNPRVFLLDEVTAELDRETAAALIQSLRENADGRSIVHITHRLVEMESYERILVFNAGRLVETGSHRQLMKNGELYFRLVNAGNDILDFPGKSGVETSESGNQPE